MKLATATWVLRILAVPAVGAFTAGCSDRGSPLIVEQLQAPANSMEGCGSTDKGARLAEGVLDVGVEAPRSYILFPLLTNTLKSLRAGMLDPEQNTVEVTGARVQIEGPPGLAIPWTETCPPNFEFPNTVLLLPTEKKAIKVEGLRSCHTKILRGMFEAGQLNPSVAETIRFRLLIRGKGKHGSTGIETDVFEFPMRICLGCLQSGFPDAAYAGFSYNSPPDCSRLSENRFKGNACYPAQGPELILCCAVDGNPEKIECPAVPRLKAAPLPAPAGVP